MNIGWPEGIVLGMAALNLLIAATLDGDKREGTHKFSVSLMAAAIQLGLLYWGGFFA